MLDRLADYLRALPAPPDYVAVTGDITNRGGREGMREFRAWLIARIDEQVLPESRRIVIVPGNHDVKWASPKPKDGTVHGTAVSWSHLARRFLTDGSPDCDPPLNVNDATLPGDGEIGGGIDTEVEFGELRVIRSQPFILDLPT